MKLPRYGVAGREKPGVLAPDGTVRDSSEVISDVAGESLLPEAIERLRKIEIRELPLVDRPGRLGPVLAMWVSSSALV